MSKDVKTLCEFKKDDIKDDLDKFRAIVKDAKFICRKCARVSNTAERLCKPEKL